MRKVTELKENEGILCTTEQEATAICKLMHEAGLRWISGQEYIKENKWINADKYGLVYIPFNRVFAHLAYAKDYDFTIYPASDFLTPEPVPEASQPRLIDFLKEGDKVWDCVIGEWVNVVHCEFDIIKCIYPSTNDGLLFDGTGRSHKKQAFPIIHLTEWHPERGEPMPTLPDPNEPRVGEVCLFGDSGYLRTIGIFTGIGNETYPYTCGDSVNFKNCIPLRGDRMPNWHELLNIKTNQ